jgi:hypothetical protein
MIGSGLGLAAALLMPGAPASAKDSIALKYASGYVEPLTKEELRAEATAAVFDPFVTAYKAKDWAGISALYEPGATIVDARAPGKAIRTKGDTVGEYFAQAPYENANVIVTRFVPEFAYSATDQNIIHTQYVFQNGNGKPFSGYRRLFKTDGTWKIDREVFPLESGKAYNMLVPKRDAFGNVYMEMKL